MDTNFGFVKLFGILKNNFGFGSFLCLGIFWQLIRFSYAQHDETTSTNPTDAGWTLMNAYLVFFMQCGFAMLECGMVRAKNAKNIVLKNVVDTGVGSLGWWLLGYPFAFGSNPSNKNGFIGLDNFLLLNFEQWDNWMFQWAFCATSATIASGCMAERTQFTSYLLYTFVVSVWIYPLPAHWIWSKDGWLHNLGSNGMIDFAGGGVVHLLGGTVGLMGAIVARPRLGRFKETTEEIPGHNIVLSALGTFILWFGWYGFNSGSTRALEGDKFIIAGRIAVTTTLCSTSAALTAFIWVRIERKQYDMVMLLNGSLVGLVSSTSGCAVIQPYAMIFVGCISGMCLIGGSKLLVKLQIDDPLDAAPVHVAGGAWGLISVCLFADKGFMEEIIGRNTNVWGLFYGGGWEQVGLQFLGLFTIFSWTSFFSLCLFIGLNRFHLLRVPADAERAGLDNTKHGGPAYPYFQMAELP